MHFSSYELGGFCTYIMKFAYLDVGVEEFLVHWPLVDIQGVLHFEVYDYF